MHVTTTGWVAIAVWVFLGWVPALLVTRWMIRDDRRKHNRNASDGEAVLMFTVTWVFIGIMIPIVIVGILAPKLGAQIKRGLK